MPTYKLVYFNARGRAELCRLMFSYAGQEYEDKRLEFSAWGEIKPKSLFGHLPMLAYDDGKFKLSESGAIVRFVAKQLDLCGKDAFEAATADMIYETLAECGMKFMTAHFEKDADKKKAAIASLEETFMPAYLANLEKLLKCNNEGKGYFVGSGVTYADIAFYNSMFTAQMMLPNALDKTPLLKDLYTKIADLPAIKDWVAKRPETTN